MTAEQLIQYLVWAIYVVIFLVVVAKAARHPDRANVDILIFFTIPAVVALFVASGLDLVAPGPWFAAISVALLLSLAYMLMRLADDFLDVSAARIGLWDQQTDTLRFSFDERKFDVDADEQTTTGQVFVRQQPIFTEDGHGNKPGLEELRQIHQVKAILAAPITAGERRLGVLTVFAPRSPIFAEDDLALVQLLADQAAVILESRALIDEATRAQAREQVARLKEDFLSAAAHDLKTPLTTLIAQAQLLELRATRKPDAPLDLAGIRLIVKEAQRLRQLVLELLDAARAEQGRLVGEREPVDLAALARETCERLGSDHHSIALETGGAIVGDYDPNQIMQLLENLVENAIKYSPEGGEVQVRVWTEDRQARIIVRDRGIGIPAEDLPHIFDRFYRATNVDDRRFAGMGLGLFICRAIVEQHGGRIWVMSRPGQGTTFHVTLPLIAEKTLNGA